MWRQKGILCPTFPERSRFSCSRSAINAEGRWRRTTARGEVRFCGRYLGLVRSGRMLGVLRAYLPAKSASRRKHGGVCRVGRGVPWYGVGMCLKRVGLLLGAVSRGRTDAPGQDAGCKVRAGCARARIRARSGCMWPFLTAMKTACEGFLMFAPSLLRLALPRPSTLSAPPSTHPPHRVPRDSTVYPRTTPARTSHAGPCSV